MTTMFYLGERLSDLGWKMTRTKTYRYRLPDRHCYHTGHRIISGILRHNDDTVPKCTLLPS